MYNHPAPALARKKNKTDQAAGDDKPRWASGDVVQDTWTTRDPDSRTTQWSSQDPGQHDAGRSWYDDVDSSIKQEDDPDGVEAFKRKFVSDAEILNNDGPLTNFDRRNRKVLGIGANRGKILNVVGNKAYTIHNAGDNRAALLDRDGNYLDGISRGEIKQRHRKEREKRLAERDREISECWKNYQAWKALPEAEKELLREEKRKKDQLLMGGLHFEEIEADEVVEMSVDLSSFHLQDDAEIIPAPRRWLDQQWQSHRHGSRSDRESSERDSVPSRHHSSHSKREFSAIPGVILYQNDLLATPTPTNAQAPHLLRDKHHASPAGSYGQRSQLAAPSPRPSFSSITFDVIEHPEYLPFEDVKTTLPMATSAAKESTKRQVMDLSRRKGRVVVVRLDPLVSVHFPEAISDRLFSGMVQEIQFFPQSRHAVVCFLTPPSAAAFLRHVTNIRANSEQQFRSLQITASWYKSNEQSSIWPGQEILLDAVCNAGATRVLEIKNIEKHLKKEEAEDAIKRSIGLERLVVKGRLVTPVKHYLKAEAHSNKLRVEFGSIRDAIDVHDLINSGGVHGFEICEASFFKDPVDKKKPAVDFCDCRWCEKGRHDARLA